MTPWYDADARANTFTNTNINELLNAIPVKANKCIDSFDQNIKRIGTRDFTKGGMRMEIKTGLPVSLPSMRPVFRHFVGRSLQIETGDLR